MCATFAHVLRRCHNELCRGKWDTSTGAGLTSGFALDSHACMTGDGRDAWRPDRQATGDRAFDLVLWCAGGVPHPPPPRKNYRFSEQQGFSMKFDVTRFRRFLRSLVIDTKDKGLIRLGDHLMGTQEYFLQEVVRGLEDGVHEFWVLKGRQVAITTFMLAVGLYWNFIHKGMRSSLVADSGTNKQMFYNTLKRYYNGLPDGMKIEALSMNRDGFEFANRSSLLFQVAGQKAGNSRLGQGTSSTFLHATEIASYGSEEGLASLQASLAQSNPDRLFVYESTALGYNHFHDSYWAAKKSVVQRGIFVGWWLHPGYSIPEGDKRFAEYWDGRYTPEEKEWIRDVKRQYGVDIRREQVVWYRWFGSEKIADPEMMQQEFPATEDRAFLLTGGAFFSSMRITESWKLAQLRKPECRRIEIGHDFTDMVVVESNERQADLRVWEEPVDGAFYVAGADVAYGSSDTNDNSVLSIWRCYADGLDQVAEFRSAKVSPVQFAWVIAYLCGAYRNVLLNPEVNGPGQTVMSELKKLRSRAGMLGGGTAGAGLGNVSGAIRYYLWRKNDTFLGPGSSLGWITSHGTKWRMLSVMKDYYERGMVEVRSLELIEEMRTFVNDDGNLYASAGSHDDLVIGAALAMVAFAEDLQLRLLRMNYTRGRAADPDYNQKKPGVTHVAQKLVQRQLGIRR